MSDLRSFLRYLFPGIVLIAEFALLLFASGGLADLTRFIAWAPQAGLGGSTVLIGAIAGLGVLLATTHHTLYWTCDGYRAADLSGSVMALNERERLKRLLPGAPAVDSSALRDPQSAWQVHTALWHLYRKSSPLLDSATARVESLTDLMHAAGTALIASIMAGALALPYLAQTREGLDLRIAVLVMIPAWSVLIALHWRSYRILGEQVQGVANTALVAALWNQAMPAAAEDRTESGST